MKAEQHKIALSTYNRLIGRRVRYSTEIYVCQGCGFLEYYLTERVKGRKFEKVKPE